MKKILGIYLCVVSVIFCFFPLAAGAQDKDVWVPVAMHIATTVSDGTLSVDEVIKAARDEGVKAVILTDRDFMKWEYGFWPLRKIIRKTIEANSVFKYGLSNYLDLIGLKSIENPDILLIPGLESAPYYDWTGSLFSQDLTIRDWHKHLLVILPEAEDYRALPVFLNPQARNTADAPFDLLKLWPVLVLVFGSWAFQRPACSYKDIKGRELGRPSTRCRVIGSSAIILSVFFIINNYPFRKDAIDPYAPAAGDAPYQKVIDYVNAREGLVFWAHPEARFSARQGRVAIETGEAIENMRRTEGYTGFSVFHEGYEQVGKPGGAWDDLLKEYCAGKRKSPVWATAGLAFDSGTVSDLKDAMRSLRLDVFVKLLTKEGLLDAMKKGRMAMTRGADAARHGLAEFFVIDDPSGKVATLGEELVFDGTPLLCVKSGGPAGGAQAKVAIIRDGVVFKELAVPSDFDIVVEDRAPLPGKTYYRLEIRQGGSLTVTNPIFVVPGEGKNN